MTIDELIKYNRESRKKYIDAKYLSSEPKEVSHSPSKKYRFEITHYADEGINKQGNPYHQSFMTCSVYKGEERIFSINGSTAFYAEWVERNDENSFLICTECYQGYGVLNLNTLEYKFFLPPEALNGMGYIWVGGHLSPGNDKIAIIGCVWGWPYQIKIFDLQSPMTMPYAVLFETSYDNEYSEIIGWRNNSEFLFKDSKNIEVIAKTV